MRPAFAEVEAMAAPLAPGIPLEQVVAPSPENGGFLGGAHSRSIYRLRTALYDACLYTALAPRAEHPNPASATLHSDGSGQLYAGLFDPSDGAWPHESGATTLAAREFFKAMRALARRGALPRRSERSLLHAAIATHRRLAAVGPSGRTFFLGTVLLAEEALALSTGAPPLLHFRYRGAFDPVEPQTGPTRSRPPTALGEASTPPSCDLYRWKVQPNDTVVLASRVVREALSLEEIGDVIDEAPDVDAALRELLGMTLSRIRRQRVRPGEVSLVLARRHHA